jgi:hypothetical protein
MAGFTKGKGKGKGKEVLAMNFHMTEIHKAVHYQPGEGVKELSAYKGGEMSTQPTRDNCRYSMRHSLSLSKDKVLPIWLGERRLGERRLLEQQALMSGCGVSKRPFAPAAAVAGLAVLRRPATPKALLKVRLRLRRRLSR